MFRAFCGTTRYAHSITSPLIDMCFVDVVDDVDDNDDDDDNVVVNVVVVVLLVVSMFVHTIIQQQVSNVMMPPDDMKVWSMKAAGEIDIKYVS